MSELAPISISSRGLLLLLAAALLAPLVIAATLTPDVRGMGTHQQLGLPVCSWPVALGIPCPSCGMTTAFAYAVRGQFLQAIVAQPMGALLALGAAIGFLVTLGIALTGYQLQRVFDPLLNWWGVGAALIFFLAAWFWKFALVAGWIQ